jgi:hypothetical protein
MGRKMRDPWLPIILTLIVILSVWLGILGPLPGEVENWFYKWQTLCAATVASIAAYIAYRNTTHSLNHAEKLERQRRDRKLAAIRAVLPLALARVVDYAQRSAIGLYELIDKCDGEKLPGMIVPEDFPEPPPDDTLRTLADFIEYSDTLDVSIIESMVAWIQIHDARMNSLVKDNRDPSGGRLVLRIMLEGYIIDAASIYAGAAAFFNYARRRDLAPPRVLTWDAVRNALRNMRFWDEEYPSLFKILKGREANSAGPFETLKNKGY